MDSIPKMKNLISPKSESFYQHLDISDLNEMHFERNLAQTLKNQPSNGDKIRSISFMGDFYNDNAAWIDKSKDMIAKTQTEQRPFHPRFENVINKRLALPIRK